MKIIVEISDNHFKTLQKMNECGLGYYQRAILNGTPLPKGHGRLGDLDKIKKEMQYYHDDCAETSEYTRLGFETAIAVVEDAPTIIEADKENKE